MGSRPVDVEGAPADDDGVCRWRRAVTCERVADVRVVSSRIGNGQSASERSVAGQAGTRRTIKGKHHTAGDG
jgi:hypothetical protein